MNRVMKRKKGRLRSRSKGAERGRQGKQWNRRDEKRRQERGANRWREKSRKTHIERRLSAPCSTEWAGSSECCVSWRSKDILHRSEQRPMHLQIEIIFEVASCEIGTPFSNLWPGLPPYFNVIGVRDMCQQKVPREWRDKDPRAAEAEANICWIDVGSSSDGSKRGARVSATGEHNAWLESIRRNYFITWNLDTWNDIGTEGGGGESDSSSCPRRRKGNRNRSPRIKVVSLFKKMAQAIHPKHTITHP